MDLAPTTKRSRPATKTIYGAPAAIAAGGLVTAGAQSSASTAGAETRSEVVVDTNTTSTYGKSYVEAKGLAVCAYLKGSKNHSQISGPGAPLLVRPGRAVQGHLAPRETQGTRDHCSLVSTAPREARQAALALRRRHDQGRRFRSGRERHRCRQGEIELDRLPFDQWYPRVLSVRDMVTFPPAGVRRAGTVARAKERPGSDEERPDPVNEPLPPAALATKVAGHHPGLAILFGILPVSLVCCGSARPLPIILVSRCSPVLPATETSRCCSSAGSSAVFTA